MKKIVSETANLKENEYKNLYYIYLLKKLQCFFLSLLIPMAFAIFQMALVYLRFKVVSQGDKFFEMTRGIYCPIIIYIIIIIGVFLFIQKFILSHENKFIGKTHKNIDADIEKIIKLNNLDSKLLAQKKKNIIITFLKYITGSILTPLILKNISIDKIKKIKFDDVIVQYITRENMLTLINLLDIIFYIVFGIGIFILIIKVLFPNRTKILMIGSNLLIKEKLDNKHS